MDLEAYWQRALKGTEVIRPRIEPLSVSGQTDLPYIFLAESAVNSGDTVVRQGHVWVEKPSIALPSNNPQFQGFEETGSAWDPERLMHLFLIRGVKFPSWKYDNRTGKIEVFEGRLKLAVDHYSSALQQKENVSTGLVIGPEDCWQFSLMIFIGAQVFRQADSDFGRLWQEFKKRWDLP